MSTSTKYPRPNELVSHIPVEVWQSIYAFLDREDLSNISLSSRFFRQTAAQLLFRRVRLSEESIEGFGSNGSLGYLAGGVRDIFFTKPLQLPHDPSYLTIFKTPKTICSNLSIFPNIKGVHISYTSDEFYYWIYPIAILRSICVYPWFRTLQNLSIKGVGMRLEDYMIFGQLPNNPFSLPLHPDDVEFVTAGGRQLEDITFDETVPFPTGLTEFSIYYVLKPNFSEYHSRSQARWLEGRVDNFPGLNVPVLYPGWITKLEKLTFRTKDLDHWAGVQPIYPGIKYLHIITEDCSWKDLERIAVRFPGVEEFRLETVVFVVLPHGYRFLYKFPKLRRARVPWRTAFRGELKEEKRKWYLGPAVEIGALREEVAGLVSGDLSDGLISWGGMVSTTTGGMRELEYVEFVRGYQKIPLKHQFDSREIPYEEYGVEVCRVWRDGVEWDVRLGDVWRRFPGVYEGEEWGGYGANGPVSRRIRGSSRGVQFAGLEEAVGRTDIVDGQEEDEDAELIRRVRSAKRNRRMMMGQ
ncbi:hypothetical protein TWF506_004898 [Arthrobotrys conoides]|uniref:F-box domain-containing protein n=1 Tax=Arthrobotrys conoides TaxID=74498 RepID=A0AAN8NI42_9PEZI